MRTVGWINGIGILPMLFAFSGCLENPSDTGSGRPEFVVRARDTSVVFGGDVAISVSVAGDPEPAIEWSRDGELLEGETGTRLTIEDAVLADAGIYVVRITNKRGSESDTFVLGVSGGEPVIGKQSTDDTIALGDTSILFVQAAGDTPLEYRWFRNGTALSEVSTCSLRIEGAGKDDPGIYTVVVTNGAGSDTSGEIVLFLRPATLFVVETDYQSGLLEWFNTGDNYSPGEGHLGVFSDAVIRTYGGFLYVLERIGGDNVLKFDPSKPDETGVLYQVHLGDNWNPQDIRFVGDSKAYIANQDEPVITIFDPAAGRVTGGIDISGFTFNPDSNSSPHACRMALSSATLYVMLQRRNGFNPGAPTMILAIDTETDLVEDTIVCKYSNGHDMVLSDGALYVTNPGDLFSTGDGGIEKIDLNEKTVSTVMDEDELGGNPDLIVHKDGTVFYVQNYVGWQDVSVVEIDAAEGEITAELPGIKDAFGGMCWDEAAEKLYVGERDAGGAGVLVFENNVKVSGPLRSERSLPPGGLVLMR